MMRPDSPCAGSPPAPLLATLPGLVLAAGASRRMGRCKLTLPFPSADGKPSTVLGRVLEAAHAGGCDPLFVTVQPDLSPELDAVLCAAPCSVRVPATLASLGQAESLKAGVRAFMAQGTFSGVMVFLGDQPLVSPAVVRQLRLFFAQDPTRAAAPVCNGKRGHPVILPSAACGAVLELTGDTGARDILHNYHLRLLETGDTATVRDMDTWQAYQEMVMDGTPR